MTSAPPLRSSLASFASLVYSTPTTTTLLYKMHTKALAALTLATARGVAAFSPAVGRGVVGAGAGRSATSSSHLKRMMSSTALKANVAKLSEPSKDLLPDVDVFIFDCDGVIWRVSYFSGTAVV